MALTACLSDAPDTGEQLIGKQPEFAKGFDFIDIEGTTCLRLFDLESTEREIRCIVCEKRPSAPSEVEPYILPSDENIRIATVSTTHVSLFDAAGSIDCVGGTAFADRLLNPAGQAAVQKGKMIDLTGDKDIDQEVTLALAPHLITTYPFGGNTYELLQRAGIAVIPFSEYLETHPLGRAEWIKVAGFLTGRLAEAESAFDHIQEAYFSLNARMVELAPDDRPVVFTGSHSNGTWYAPPANSFMGVFTQDAGARYLFDDVEQAGNLNIDFEVLLDRAKDADFWGKVVYTPGELSLSDLREDDERYTYLKAFQTGNVFYCNAAETDYFGDAIVEPHVILSDLIAIFHPEILPDHRFTYFNPIAH